MNKYIKFLIAALVLLFFFLVLFIKVGNKNYEVVLRDGEIFQKYQNGKETILVSKEELLKTESFFKEFDDFPGVYKMSLAPDNKQLCFSVDLGPNGVYLFYKKIDKQNIVEAGRGLECVWSNNSKRFAFINYVHDMGNKYVYVFDTSGLKTHDIKPKSFEGIVDLENITWSKDDLKITVDYSAWDQNGEYFFPKDETGKVEMSADASSVYYPFESSGYYALKSVGGGKPQPYFIKEDVEKLIVNYSELPEGFGQ